jgi:Xaa-Pro dipeptidase
MATSGPGLLPRPDGATVDFNQLRAERRERLAEAMEAAGADVLILGRPANVAFASGATQLWTSGTRPFGPVCVVVAATGRSHLLSTWDEGVPREISHRQLFGTTWNPAVSMSNLKQIEGLDAARAVATDGWGPSTERLIGALAPAAEILDGTPILVRARSAKSPDEIACLVTAAAAAEAALTAMTSALEPGRTVAELVGVYAEAVSALGMTRPPTEGVAWVCTGTDRPRRAADRDRTLSEGDLVALQPGASFAGYEVTLGRTRRVGGGPPDRLVLPARAALDAVIAACLPGATGADLLRTWSANGGTTLHEPLVWGLGLGLEPPVIGPGVGASAALHSGAVLAVQAWLTDAEGGVLEQDAVMVGPEGPTVLTRSATMLGAGPAHG